MSTTETAQHTPGSEKYMTASEAYEIATNRSIRESALKDALTAIEKAANDGQLSCVLRGGLWEGLYDVSQSPAWCSISAFLRGLGYNVEHRINERQFVDMWTEISWKDNK